MPRALPKQTRRLLEDAIERHQAATEALVAFLDGADGDADLEPSIGFDEGEQALDDEPHDPEEGDVAYNETHGRGGQIGSDYEDDEPELGWTGDMDQERAPRHLRLDAVQGSCHSETEHDGREPDVDREPECEDEAAEHDGREPPSEPFTSGGPLP